MVAFGEENNSTYYNIFRPVTHAMVQKFAHVYFKSWAGFESATRHGNFFSPTRIPHIIFFPFSYLNLASSNYLHLH